MVSHQLRKKCPNEHPTQVRLEAELERLRTTLGLINNLEVVWQPQTNGLLSGEVRENTIFIYETHEQEAIATLRHELLDFLVSKAVQKYQEVTNALIHMINSEAYKAKEEVVEVLSRLLRDFER